MGKLPVISGAETIAALERAGFRQARTRGSHVSMLRHDPFTALTVPLHRELDRGTLRAIIRDAGLSVDEFLRLAGR
jgi:predicted RNA binding protein YcfA (HicA-like mRNA interferase family)